MKRIVLILSIIVVGAGNLMAFSPAQNSMKTIKTEKQTTQKEIKETSLKIRQNTKQTNNSLNQLNLITAEITEQKRLITDLSTQVKSLDNQVKLVNDSIEIYTKQLELLKKNYALAVKRTHARSSSMDKLMFIFSAESFRQAYRRMRYLQEFSNWRIKQSNNIKSIQNVLIAKRNQIQGIHVAKIKTLSNMNVAQSNLQAKKGKQAEVVKDLKAEGSTLKAILKEKEKKARALDRQLENLIAEEERRAAERARIAEEKRMAEERRKSEQLRIEEERRQADLMAQQSSKEKSEEQKESPKAKPQEGTKPAAQQPKPKKESKKAQKEPKRKETKVAAPQPKEDKSLVANAETKPKPIAPAQSGTYEMDANERALSGSFESNKGNLLFPVTGSYKIVRPFGRQRHPDLPYVETDNGGIDIETGAGASARAVFNGKVSAVFQPDGFNTVVMVRHGNFLSIYVNLSQTYVRSGQEIKAGQPIGKIFSDPEDNNRTILHFEIRKEKEKLNPQLWLR